MPDWQSGGVANCGPPGPTCGTPVFSGLSGGPLQVIKAGTLDDPSWLKPALEIWTDSAQPWAPRATGIAQMPRNPG